MGKNLRQQMRTTQLKAKDGQSLEGRHPCLGDHQRYVHIPYRIKHADVDDSCEGIL